MGMGGWGREGGNCLMCFVLLLLKMTALKGKHLLPWAAIFFPLVQTPFQQGPGMQERKQEITQK